MLIKAKTLCGYHLLSLDGEIGKVKELYFDDKHWAIRYVVADAAHWLEKNQVLISPYALGPIMDRSAYINVALTKKQIVESPAIDSDVPVSRQFEEAYHGYYRWPKYWGGDFLWGAYPYIVRDPEKWIEPPPSRDTSDSHLRSTHDITGRHLQALDGEIGHVEDFLIDVDAWVIRYLIVDTKNWWPGKKVLIAPQSMVPGGWDNEKVYVNLSRDEIKKSLEYKQKSLSSDDSEGSRRYAAHFQDHEIF